MDERRRLRIERDVLAVWSRCDVSRHALRTLVESVMSKHFKAYTLPFSDPDLIDDCTQVYGDGWPDVDDACDKSPSGHHEFDCSLGSDPEICIHCKARC
jgi:hypothetical protein